MKVLSAFLALVLIAGIAGCSKDNRSENPSCGKAVLISGDLYNTTPRNYTISDASISGDCLEIRFAASGCSGQTWVTELVDKNEIAKTNPPMRLIRLALTNNEMCAAVFTRTVFFDLKPLRLHDSDEILLNLDGLNKELIYRY